MDSKTAKFLIQLNLQFYQRFASHFSSTRGRVNDGVRQILDQTRLDANILDLGCGNGSVAAALAERGFTGNYTGVDFSENLLGFAREQVAGNPHFTFHTADLTDLSTLPAQLTNFDIIFSFATMHHIPSNPLRLAFLQQVHARLTPIGQFIHSNWQFLNSPKLAARVQDWARVDLKASDVDENDYLLDWQAGGAGLRYVHQYDEAELASLAHEAGFDVMERFYSDGKGGNLGLYGVWAISNKPTSS